MSANAKITSQTLIDKKGIDENRANFDFTVDANTVRPPDYFIYVYNVGEMEHRKEHPLVKNSHIPACPAGKKYILCFKLPNILNQGWADPDNGQLRTHGAHGERVAMDFINPNNLGVDQDAKIDMSNVFSVNNDLSLYGLFWSKSNPPSEVEVNKAMVRMENFYREKLRQAASIIASGRFDKDGNDRITNVMHVAADHFKIKASWHTQEEVPGMCPNCGEDIVNGIAYHINRAGNTCIIDAERAAAAGVRIAKN